MIRSGRPHPGFSTYWGSTPMPTVGPGWGEETVFARRIANVMDVLDREDVSA